MSSASQLVCSCCGEYHSRTLKDLLRHIRLQHADSPTFNIQCGIQNCRRTFVNFHTFRNHAYVYHAVEDQPDQPLRVHDDDPDLLSSSYDLPSGSSGADDSLQGDLESPITFLSDPVSTIKRTAAVWILKVRECHQIPQSVIELIIRDIESLHQVCF